MTTLDIKTESGDVHPRYFLANEWAKEWNRRVLMAAMDGHYAATTMASQVGGLGRIFEALAAGIGVLMDALTEIESDYCKMLEQADKWDNYAKDHASLLMSMTLNAQWTGGAKSEVPTEIEECIAFARSFEAAVLAAAHSRRRWNAEHYKAIPF
jgi:hypothetical protein